MSGPAAPGRVQPGRVLPPEVQPGRVLPPGVQPGRVLLVTVSARLPPGLLSWPAWQALHAGPVLVAEAEPQLAALQAASVDVHTAGAGEDVAARLHAWATRGATAVWLGAVDGAPAAAVAGLFPAVSVEVVPGSHDPPGAALLDVVAVMDRLRSPGGCPWDAAQTHSSLKPHLLEEAYEAYEALEDGDLVALREELGDVLLQVAFHARLAQEAEPGWSIDDLAGDLVDKLVRRHPHVFAGGSADDLETTWEEQKAAEKGRTSLTEGVPLGQPALALAARLHKRAARLGAPVPGYDGLGGELWELVRRCRAAGLDPEDELRRVARRYRDEVLGVEQALLAQGSDPREVPVGRWNALWPG